MSPFSQEKENRALKHTKDIATSLGEVAIYWLQNQRSKKDLTGVNLTLEEKDRTQVTLCSLLVTIP